MSSSFKRDNRRTMRCLVVGLALLAAACTFLAALGILPNAALILVCVGFGSSVAALVVWTAASGWRRR